MSDPNKFDLYKSGMGHYTHQNYDAALKDFVKALELDPEFADVHQSLGHVYEKLGDLDAALTSVKRAAEINPDDFLVHTSLSMFYQRVGMISEAEAEKAKAAELQAKQQTT